MTGACRNPLNWPRITILHPRNQGAPYIPSPEPWWGFRLGIDTGPSLGTQRTYVVVLGGGRYQGIQNPDCSELIRSRLGGSTTGRAAAQQTKTTIITTVPNLPPLRPFKAYLLCQSFSLESLACPRWLVPVCARGGPSIKVRVLPGAGEGTF